MPVPPRRFHLVTLGCPKNAVDSEKMAAALARDGVEPTDDVGAADLVVLNTCAFIEAAREESVGVALELAAARRPGARLVVTGCMAERYGAELADALPEADAVVGFAGEATLASDVLGLATPVGMPRRKPSGVADLLDLPRRAPAHPWAYLKVAEGCDRACAFCAIPTFRGRQVSRSLDAIVDEATALVEGGVSELVLVAQDVAWYGRDLDGTPRLADVMGRLDALAPAGLARQRLLYLYPSEVKGPLLDAVLDLPTAVPYFDFSLQHASASLLRRMKRWGSGERFRSLVDEIRARRPDAAFRSSFIVGFPGETEDDHDELLAFLEGAELDWAGFFPFSREDDTAAASMEGAPPPDVVGDRIRELQELQDRITAGHRHALVGTTVEVFVDEWLADDLAAGGRPDGPEGAVAIGRTHREAPEIDGVVYLHGDVVVRPGVVVEARVTGVAGPDLQAEAVAVPAAVGAG
ncbi:MAG TPA: 30S ribosomal protein S12 methylthiotransferase RimO [Acidimicrobiia bacterium]|nr:30S ribosomal protein S12 methylthiotransferase RimO [Acidimicrobiia bacterium]